MERPRPVISRFHIAALAMMLGLLAAVSTSYAGPRDVSFLATADPQYENNPRDHTGDCNCCGDCRRGKTNLTMSDMVNKLRSQDTLRGIVVAGDLTQNARLDEWEAYKEARKGVAAKFYDGVGNHDTDPEGNCCAGLGHSGFCVCKATILKDMERVRATKFATAPDKGLGNYSWDWEDVHFVQLHKNPGTLFNSAALAADLNRHVGKTGRPVILIHHFCTLKDGFCDNDHWWTGGERIRYWEIVAPFNVVALIEGHNHTPGSGWSHLWSDPLGRTARSIPAFIVGGALEGNFTEIRITSDTLKAVRWKFGETTLQPGGSLTNLVRRNPPTVVDCKSFSLDDIRKGSPTPANCTP